MIYTIIVAIVVASIMIIIMKPSGFYITISFILDIKLNYVNISSLTGSLYKILCGTADVTVVAGIHKIQLSKSNDLQRH